MTASIDPFYRALVLGAAAFAAILLGALIYDSACNRAYGRDDRPPPVIAPIVFGGSVRAPSVREVPHAAPADGPMCQALDFVREDEPPSLLALLLEEPPTLAERERIERALTVCDAFQGRVRASSDPFRLLAVLRYERELGAPAGFFFGALCIESAMRARPSRGEFFAGDLKNGVYRARGPLQLHENVWGKTCGGRVEDADDVLWAMGCYWAEIQRVRAKADRIGVVCDDMLRVSEAAAANVRRYGWRCSSASAHWRLMEAAQ